MAAAVLTAAALSVYVDAQGTRLPAPMDEWKHNVGDDYFLANYQQLTDYWTKLAKESNRLHVVEIGKTAEGRPMLMADHHVAGQLREARRATRTSRAGSRSPRA